MFARRCLGRRGATAALILAALAAALTAAPAIASKQAIDYVGGGEGGVEFSNPGDVAVNSSGAGPADAGDFYVADTGKNRIQRFDSEGGFLSAWGADVHGIDERQELTVHATGGTFTLEFEGETTAPIPWDPSKNLEKALPSYLEALPAIGKGNVAVSIPGMRITFVGELAGTDVPELVADSSGLTGGYAPEARITQLADGAGGNFTGYEVCTEAALCKAGVATGGNPADALRNGALNRPQSVAVDQDTGEVYVSDGGNNRVDVYDGVGNFIRSFGRGVVRPGDPGHVPGVDEVQKVTIDPSATGGTFALSFKGAASAPIPWNASPAQVQLALEEVAGIGAGGVSVASANPGGGTPGGPYEVTFQGSLGELDVPALAASAAGLIATTKSVTIATLTEGGPVYDVCEAPAVCRQGTAGSGVGQLGSSANGIAVSPPDGSAATGTVFLADPGNRRVDTYNLDGQNPSSVGSEAVFGAEQPRKVAVDSRGILYASNDKAAGEVERYDTENANGEGAGFLEPISAARNEEQSLHFTSFAEGNLFTLTCPNGEATEGIEWTTRNSLSGPTLKDNIQTALEAKCGTGDFSLSQPGDGDIIVTYTGALAGTGIPPMTCTKVTGSGSCAVSKEIDGHGGALLAGTPASATVGLGVDPDSDGGGPETDILYVLRDRSPGSAVVQQFGPAEEPGLSTAPVAADDAHGDGADFGTRNFNVPQGLGVDGPGGRLFVSEYRVYILADPVPPPAATLDPVSTFDARSATFTGTVDPNGARTSYRFEYVEDAEFQANGFADAKQVPFADADLGAGDAPVAVQADAHGLTPGTTYRLRLLATQVLSKTDGSDELTFTTTAAPPSVAAAANVASGEEATLRGAINPHGQATDYHFEWGASEGYGNSTPAGHLPAGSKPVAIAAELSGLAPGQAYHYRLIATNGAGTTTGSDQAFATPAGPPQLPQRGYELVSWYPTGGIPYVAGNSLTQSGKSGDEITFGKPSNPVPGSAQPPPEDQQHGGDSYWQYESKRGPDGWHVFEFGLATTNSGGGISADGTRFLTEFNEEPKYLPGSPRFTRADPDDRNYAEDVYLRQPDGRLVWISRDPRIPAGTPQTAGGDGALVTGTPATKTMSADGSTVVFKSGRQLLAADTTPDSRIWRLYKWQEGRISLVGVRPDGSVPDGSVNGVPSSSLEAISRDGSRVLFSARRTDYGGGLTLYMQRDGQPTVEVAKETSVPALAGAQPYDVKFSNPVVGGAASDLSRVFFTSASRLTPDSGAGAKGGGDADLYVYDLAADKVRDITPRLDGIEDPEVDPAEADRAGVRNVAATSEDGRRVYFTARARYPTAPNPEGELPLAGGENLYLAELDGIDDPVKLHFVATIATLKNDQFYRKEFREQVYTSPDGSVLGFGSYDPLTGQGLGGTSQLFVYEVGPDTLACASCPSDGTLPAGSVNEITFEKDEQQWQPYKRDAIKHWIGSDGTAFFHTPTALLAADENTVDDVYAYREGKLQLISSGKGTRPAKFEDASADGGTVFFITYDALAPQDKEPGIPKLYAARVGGGFPYVAPQPPCDLNGGACEGAPSSAPDVPGAGTEVFEGPGNPKPKRSARRCPRGKRTVRRHGKVRCVPRHRKRHSAKRRHRRTAKHDRRAER